ncbi:MAG: hypothetical protein AAGJ70_04570 [Pseudomonadota bacterium]
MSLTATHAPETPDTLRRQWVPRRKHATRLGVVIAALLTATPPALAACHDVRAANTTLLSAAMEDRDTARIARALSRLRAEPRFAERGDPTGGRRPRRSSYGIKFSDRRLERRAGAFVTDVERAQWWRTLNDPPQQPRARGLGEIGGQIRGLLAIAERFPKLADRAIATAREMANVIRLVSNQTGLPAAPLAPAARMSERSLFIREPLSTAIRNCDALKQSMTNGWLVTGRAPELHYRETAEAGAGLIALVRTTSERRWLAWVRDASAWYSRHPIAPNIAANAAAAGLDAELYILTAEEKYLTRGFDRIEIGVLPAFGRENNAIIIDRLPLSELMTVTHGLLQLATALAAAPITNDGPSVRALQISEAAARAYALVEMRAHANRRLQYPAGLIELALDLDRASRAGAATPAIDPDLFRHALAHGADRIARGIQLPGGAGGRLLARLQPRAWDGAFRTPPAAASSQSTSQGSRD